MNAPLSGKGSRAYRGHYTVYCNWDRPQAELFNIIRREFELPEPVDNHIFAVEDPQAYCEYHRAK